MPRAFDSSASRVLHFAERVDCPICYLTFEATFHGSGTDLDDITEAPTGLHTCPACHHQWASSMTGWTFFTEAG